MRPRDLWQALVSGENLLLKAGVIMMVGTLVLAAGVVAVVVLVRGGHLVSAPTDPAAEKGSQEEQQSDYDPGQKLDIDDEEKARKNKKPKIESLPVYAQDWPEPSRSEISEANGPRYYQPQQDATLSLTVEALGLYDVPVMNEDSKEALDRGVIHLPQTPFPWEDREQKNVYLAGHRLGYEGTGSRLVFYNLDKLKEGDSVILTDGSGTPYEYEVSEVFVAEPDADWVVDPVRGRDMLTLQTCTMPDFVNRLVVRADRV